MLTTWMVLKPAGLLSSQGHQEYSNENTPYMTFHYFKKSLLSAYYEIVSVLGSWNTSVNTDKYPNSLGVSVQFSHSVVSDSLRPHKPQHARPPCPSPTPVVHPNPCPLSRWCHSAISSSVVPFSSCPQSCPASGSFQWVRFSHQVAKVLEFQLQHQSFRWTPRTDLL